MLNIIDQTKRIAETRSAKLYLDTIKTTITKANLYESFNPSNCDITSDGNNLSCEGKVLEIKSTGSRATEGLLTLKDDAAEKFINARLTDVNKIGVKVIIPTA